MKGFAQKETTLGSFIKIYSNTRRWLVSTRLKLPQMHLILILSNTPIGGCFEWKIWRFLEADYVVIIHSINRCFNLAKEFPLRYDVIFHFNAKCNVEHILALVASLFPSTYSICSHFIL